MDDLHRFSILTTFCDTTPVSPRTRTITPVTLYKRGKEFRGSTEERNWSPKAHGDSFHSKTMNFESDTESKHSLHEKKNQDSENRIDVSTICYSNIEYYMQLEILKNAHEKTMAQLEKMYQNKLHLKGVLPLERKENTANRGCRSTSPKSSLEQADLPKFTSESDVNSPVSSGLSNDCSEESTNEENGSETGILTSAPLHILKMWNGFSVDDYAQRRWHGFPSKLGNKKKAKNWSKKVTIPEPFQMTIRETKKKKQKVKSKLEIEMENNLLKKQLEEEEICQRNFRANPVPAFVFLPLYQEIIERNEERRKFVKDRSKEILLASQKPFQFIEREERKKDMKKLQLQDLAAPKTKTSMFKAKPVPKSVYSSAISDQLKEDDLYRAIRIQMRAQELLQSSVPPSMLASRCYSGKGKSKCEPKRELNRKPQINFQVPDFEVLHRKFQKQLLKRRDAKQVTICEPFYLRTLDIPSNKEKILKDIQADEDERKETRWPYMTPRRKPQLRCSSISPSFWSTLESERSRTMESTKRRQQVFRKHEKQRMREYFKELEEMRDRVNKRPLLLERVTQQNARRSAEKHYANVLKEVGLSNEFVSMKGQTPKQLEHFSDEFENHSDGTESLQDDRSQGEESEDEENYPKYYGNNEANLEFRSNDDKTS